MRTKALIGAAIAMAAGILTASAQVYSVNVVGYVNQVNTGGALSLIANPLDDGTNNLADVLASCPKGSQVQIWNGSGFTVITKSGATGLWGTNAHIPPGTGFFIKPSSTFTNTYVGNVVVAPGGGQTNLALAAGTLQLIGSPVPFSGLLTDTGTNTLNLGACMPKGTQLQLWTGNGYYVDTKSGATGNWSSNATINIGQGFFCKPSSATNWVQTLQ